MQKRIAKIPVNSAIGEWKSKFKNLKARKYGFSLAEVLITIGIIGVVAAIITPMMGLQHRERQMVGNLRKFYSQMTQSFSKNMAENGDPSVWGLGAANNAVGANVLMDHLIGSYYQIIENCKTDGGCWNDGEITYLDYSSSGLNLATSAIYSTTRIIDGSLIATRVIDGTCNSVYGTSRNFTHVCGEMLIDLNGRKAPNQFGYDTYKFYITKFGIYPAGERTDTTTSFDDTCLKKQYGVGCAGWVIQKTNMDYLHCEDIGWQKKSSCKDIFNYDHSTGI